jgi:hypothetical protein
MAEKPKFQHPSKLFYNFNLDAYQCHEKPQGHVYLRVRGWTARPVVETTPPVTPTEEETKSSATDDDGIGRALWVGMWPTCAPQFRTKQKGKTEESATKKPRAANSRSITKLIESAAEINLLAPDAHALRVVVNSSTSNMQFYVLCNPDASGLCETKQIEKEEVFFAPEYRQDGLTKVEDRRTKWPREIRAALESLPQKSMSQLFRPKNQKQTADIEIPDSIYEVQQLLTDYAVNPTSDRIKLVVQKLEELDHDLKFKPPPSSRTITKLVELHTVFSKEDAELMTEEMKVCS